MKPGWKSHENLPEFVNEIVEIFLPILDLFNQGLYKWAVIVYFILIIVLFFFSLKLPGISLCLLERPWY